MTAKDVVDYVRGIINSPISGYITDDEIIGWINQGLLEFYSVEGIESVYTYEAVNGDTEVPFDSNIIRVADLWVKDSEGKDIDIDEVDYQIFGNTIYFRTPNTVDGTYYVKCFRVPTPVSQTTDVIEIPKIFETAIKNYALAQAYLKDENYNLYQQQMTLFYQKANQHKMLNRKVNERNRMKITKGW